MTFRTTLALGLAVVIGTGAASAQSAPPFDTARIEQMSGLKGTYAADEKVFKIGKPRNDVRITVDGYPMPPFMGLGSWAAFTPGHGQDVMMMGDTVVFEDEVNPAMSAALDAGLEVTALHNHFFFDEPKVYFMHIGGTGEPGALAAGVKRVYDTIASVRSAAPKPTRVFPHAIAAANAIDAAPLETALGVKGQASDGMYKVVIGRPAAMHGARIGKEMGVNTWASFGGSNEEAVIDGDFAMTANELQTVLRSMRREGINIVAIHSHMSEEEPRYFFLHYWGKGKALALAQSFRRVLDAQEKAAR